MDYNYVHSSHYIDETLRVIPSKVNMPSLEFGQLENQLMQENQNIDSVLSIEAIKKLITYDEFSIYMFHTISHLINTHAKPLMDCAQELGYTPPSTTIESSSPISTTLPTIPTYSPPFMKTSISSLIL